MITREQQGALRQLGDRYPDHYMHKFCDDAPRWYSEALRIHEGIGRGATQSRKILDIGCGFGYFVRACNEVGDHATGIDVPDSLIEAAAAILGVPYLPYMVTAYVPLPDTYRDLDLVTLFGVMFRFGSASESRDYWGWSEYTFLARDICSRLRPGGRWIIRPNRRGQQQHEFADIFDVAQWTAATGEFATAIVAGEQVAITPKTRLEHAA